MRPAQAGLSRVPIAVLVLGPPQDASLLGAVLVRARALPDRAVDSVADRPSVAAPAVARGRGTPPWLLSLCPGGLTAQHGSDTGEQRLDQVEEDRDTKCDHQPCQY